MSTSRFNWDGILPIIAALVGSVLTVLDFIVFHTISLGIVGIAVATVAVLLFYLLRRIGSLIETQRIISKEVDILSREVLRIRASAQPMGDLSAKHLDKSQHLTGDMNAITSSVQEVIAEVGLLSGIVKELAGVVSAQDTEIEQIKRPAAATKRADFLHQGVLASPDMSTIGAAAPASILPVRRSFPEQTQPAGPGQNTAIIKALEEGNLEVWLQPIVSLPQRKVLAYEAIARLKVDEDVLSPSHFMQALADGDKAAIVDCQMLDRMVTIARHLQQRGSSATIVYSVLSQSVLSSEFLFRLKAIGNDYDHAPARLGIALPQHGWKLLDANKRAIIREISTKISIALDRPVDLRFDIASLRESGIGEIRIPAGLLLARSDHHQLSDIVIEDLIGVITRCGTRVVAVEVEQETDVPDLIDLDIGRAQGSVFAPPRAVRPNVLSTQAGPVTSVAQSEMREKEEQSRTRRPFRDFLRRAV